MLLVRSKATNKSYALKIRKKHDDIEGYFLPHLENCYNERNLLMKTNMSDYYVKLCATMQNHASKLNTSKELIITFKF